MPGIRSRLFAPRGTLEYFFEYACSLFWEFVLSVRVLFERGFDVIQACNPPDLIFFWEVFIRYLARSLSLIITTLTLSYGLLKAGIKEFFISFCFGANVLPLNPRIFQSLRMKPTKKIGVERGGKKESTVFVVRSAPQTENLEKLFPGAPDMKLKNGKQFMVWYLGVMGRQDGVDYLLRAIEHIVKKKQRTDIYFALIGKGPESQ
jgi:hypothetical protein